MNARSNRIKRCIGFALIAAIWAGLLTLVVFFSLVFALYTDLKAPAHHRLGRGARLGNLAATIHTRYFAPVWQSNPGSSQFDEQLVYVPRAGASRFSSAEFDTIVTMTANGLRQQPGVVADRESPI